MAVEHAATLMTKTAAAVCIVHAANNTGLTLIQRATDPVATFIQDVRVDHCCGDILVTEQFLQGADICFVWRSGDDHDAEIVDYH